MSYIPQRLREERDVWVRETRLPLVALGILHYTPQGGGYHEGNDLLAQGGRLHTDYSKRQSERDRPGTDAGSAIDIGYFDVLVQKVDGTWRRVTLRDYNAWMIVQLNAGAPDVAFVRELIYSMDGKTVKRWDREGKSTTGDLSHTTHSHRSDYRDDENANKAAHVERFWREMRGGAGMGVAIDYFSDGNAKAEAYRIDAFAYGRDTNAIPDGPEVGKPIWLTRHLKAMDAKLDLLLTEAAADKTRDDAVIAILQTLQTGGGSIDVASVVNAVNAAVSASRDSILAELQATREAQAAAWAAAADTLDDDPTS